MGKLIEKLERMQKTSAPRLGFAQVGAARQLSLLPIAVLPTASRNLAKAAVDNGAELLLVRQVDAETEARLGQRLGIADTIPCGGSVSGETPGARGLDFAVIDPAAAIGPVLGVESLDLVLSIPADTPDSTLRTLESLPIDAIVLPEPAVPLTVQGLIGYYRVTKATSKPVLSVVQARTEPVVLRALRDAGVLGVLVEVGNTAGARALGELRKAIEQLPPKKARVSRARMAVALGAAAAAAAAPAPVPAPEEPDEGEGE